MPIGRVMNEYESALFCAITILMGALARFGIDKRDLAAEFRSSADRCRDNDRESEASVLEILANFSESGEYFGNMPPFMVIKGGRTTSE